MQGKKKAWLLGALLCWMPVMTACSMKETLDILWGHEEEDTDEINSTDIDPNMATIDDSIQAPVLNNELGDPVTYDRNQEAEPLVIDASVTDGGTLSYQWYRNNVDSNGGGTEIAGAVSNSFLPPTQESGITYYYVVVTNTIGEGIQLTVSGTKCVTVTETEAVPADTAGEESGGEAVPGANAVTADADGSWTQSGDQWWFSYPDGTYPISKWEHIDGSWYVFDENGYMITGWYQEGENWYYLNPDGRMAFDTDVDGYHLGPDGVMQN